MVLYSVTCVMGHCIVCKRPHIIPRTWRRTSSYFCWHCPLWDCRIISLRYITRWLRRDLVVKDGKRSVTFLHSLNYTYPKILDRGGKRVYLYHKLGVFWPCCNYSGIPEVVYLLEEISDGEPSVIQHLLLRKFSHTERRTFHNDASERRDILHSSKHIYRNRRSRDLLGMNKREGNHKGWRSARSDRIGTYSVPKPRGTPHIRRVPVPEPDLGHLIEQGNTYPAVL